MPLADSWPAGGPRVVWKKPVGAGFSGPVVADGKLILFHRVRSEEVVEAMDVKTGAPIWRYAYPTNYRDDFGFDEGPRAVPVVAGGVVYTFGAQGQLHAVGLADGKKRWSEDTATRYKRGEGLLRRGRIAAGRGRPRDRERRRQGRRHRGVRRRHRQGAVDGHRRRGQLLVAGRRHDRRPQAWRCS